MAARDADYPTFTFAPAEPDIDRAIAAYGELTRREPGPLGRRPAAAGPGPRRRVHRGRAVGLGVVLRHAGRAGLVGRPVGRPVRTPGSFLAEQLLAHGLAGRDDLDAFAAGWRRWAASPDGWFAVLHGEILATA